MVIITDIQDTMNCQSRTGFLLDLYGQHSHILSG